MKLETAVVDRIRSDFATFADPPGLVTVSDNVICWTQDGVERQATLAKPSSDYPGLIYNGVTYKYRDFFASEHMADLRRLAEGLLLMLHTSGVHPLYIDGPCKTDDGIRGPGKQVLTALSTSPAAHGPTRLVFIRGDAGAGKTILLQELCRARAEAFLKGEGGALFFYIDAQGQALARLDQAMALVLQDLRARFTYHAVATLARLGVIVPIVDGFDELLGTSGYTEAFSSLARFLIRLDGQGTVIASARATFYEYSDLGHVAARYSGAGSKLDYEIVPVDVLPWTEIEIADYIDKVGIKLEFDEAASPEGSSGRVARVERELKEVLIKFSLVLKGNPFLLSKLVEFLSLAEEDVEEDSASILVGRMLSREVDKLRDTDGAPLLTVDQHFLLLERVAQEMWWQEASQLDDGTLKIVAELACEEMGLSSDKARILLHRISSHAMLSVRGMPRKLGFGHEIYYAVFVARFIASEFVGGASVNDVLSRSLLAPFMARQVAMELRARGISLRKVVERLGSRRRTVLSRDAVRVNGGAIVGNLIAAVHAADEDLVLEDLAFTGVDFADSVVSGLRFVNCEFNRVDLSGASWAVRLEHSCFTLPKVDDALKLNGTELKVPEQVVGLRIVQNDGSVLEEFEPSRVLEYLRERGALMPDAEVVQSLSEESARFVMFIRKFLRLATKTYYFSQDDLRNKGLLPSADWDVLESLLRANGLLVDAQISRRGTHGTVMKLTVPVAEIERGEAGSSSRPEIGVFWSQVRARR